MPWEKQFCGGEERLGRGGGRAYSFLFLSVSCEHIVFIHESPHIFSLKRGDSSFHLYVYLYVVMLMFFICSKLSIAVFRNEEKTRP